VIYPLMNAQEKSYLALKNKVNDFISTCCYP